jgi:hypothetical protein
MLEQAIKLTATITAVILIAASIFVFETWSMAAVARDLDGRYAQSPLKPWFDQLASGKGLCCSVADGYTVDDPDWEVVNGHYRVRIKNIAIPGDPLEWVDVPDDALIKEPNQAGRTMVWPTYGYSGVTIRCFMPGAMI